MKSNFHLLFLGALLFTSALSAPAQFIFRTNNGTLCITKYTGYGGAVTIPAMTNGLPVTDIASNAFLGCGDLTSVIIPDTVTNIGDGAFEACYQLNSVTLSANLRNIANGAFWNCFDLTAIVFPETLLNIGDQAFLSARLLQSIVIPNTVTNIGTNAFTGCTELSYVLLGSGVSRIGAGPFENCTNLGAISINALNPAFISVDGVLFSKDQSRLVEYPSGKAGSYVIPGTVTNIANDAFAACPGLTNLIIPSSVLSIGREAIANCIGLTTVSIPESVRSINDWTFSGCGGLTNVTLGNNITNIGMFAFSGCNNLRNVALPENLVSIGENAFTGCSSLTNIIIPASVTSLGNWAFFYCTELSAAYFKGNIPVVTDNPFGTNVHVFAWCSPDMTVYYLPGTSSWGNYFYRSCPSAPWYLSCPLILGPANGQDLGVQNNQFGFTVSWATNLSLVVEASTNPAALWEPLATNLLSLGAFHFSDPDWTNYPNRFYRVRSE